MLTAALALSGGAAGLLAGAPAVGPRLATVQTPRTGIPQLSTYEEYLAKLAAEKGDAPMASAARMAAPSMAEEGGVVVPTPESVADLRQEVASLKATTAAAKVGTAIKEPVERGTTPMRTDVLPDMQKVIYDASDLLSHQAIMENFVHHNPWEALQAKDWDDALEEVEEKAAYLSPSERLGAIDPLDPRIRANKAMAELGAPYLDRGLAKWEAPYRERGLLYFFAKLENLGIAPWRAHARQAAKEILEKMEGYEQTDEEIDAIAASVLQENLFVLEQDPSLWEQTTRSMMLDLPGWGGMFKRMEEHPEEGPVSCEDGECTIIRVRLSEWIAVHSIIARSSIEASATKLGWVPAQQSLSAFLDKRNAPRSRKGVRPIYGMGSEMASLQNPSGLAYKNQNFERSKELEREYSKVTLRAVNNLKNPGAGGAADISASPRSSLMFFTCFDEREESFRRYLEASADGPGDIKTFGVAGFFNMAIRYKQADYRPEEILAPEGAVPPNNHIMQLRELTPGWAEKKRFQAEVARAFEEATYSPVGSLAISGALLPYSFGRLMTRSFAPTTTMDLEDTIEAIGGKVSNTDFDSPFTPQEGADRLAQLLKNAGTMDNFARLVIGLGHGARSVNNPFLAAYNCGACCGREGGPNARVWARAANDPDVRAQLAEDHDIHIPDDTWFIGGYHDTTLDLVEMYDLERVPASHERDLARATATLDQARSKNALERCGKFFLVNPEKMTPAEALSHVEQRGRDVAESRPELGHSTNAAIIVGRRELTKGRDMDRRAFLPTYDPFNDDDEGTNLQTVLTPALVVGSGINLEYFFSTTDGGAGTKVPVNVVGNFGIQQGTAGDLLIGLATQMSELHSPQRAFYLIDAPIDRVEKCLARNQVLMNIVRNEWVRFFVRDPYSQQIFEQKDGNYHPVDALDTNVPLPAVVPFDDHYKYGKSVKAQEDIYTLIAGSIMTASTILPLYRAGWDPLMVDPQQGLITAGASVMAISSLAFSRRYLHGEFMYGRMQIDTAIMLLGFNLVASAPNLEDVALGWTIIGYASTFLIGGFNDRPTARDNAAYAFLLYQISDAALLLAIAFGAEAGAEAHPGIAAAGLIVAAAIKSSQFPFSGLFLRSMEGASPNSAVGYAGISAHAGVVLLASTMPMWYEFPEARLALGAIGGLTAFQNGIIANVRNDRKGAIASATSATIGMIYIVLALGYDDIALLLALGHGTFRMNQVLTSPGAIGKSNDWQAALGVEKAAADKVFDILWRLGWGMNRVNSDFFRLPDVFQSVDLKKPLAFYNTKSTQILITAAFLGAIGAFHLPAVDDKIAELMKTDPAIASVVLGVNILGSTALIRFLFGNVLDFGRFRNPL